MTWFRVDDGFLEHDKVQQLYETLADSEDVLHAAMHLWLAAGVYSSRNLTDGRVREARLRTLTQSSRKRFDQAVDALVSCGLMTRTDGSVELHDYAQWNPTREKVEQDRAAKASRQSKWLNERRKRDVSETEERRVSSASQDAEETKARQHPDPDPDPDPDPIEERERASAHEPPTEPVPERPARQKRAAARRPTATPLPDDWTLTPELVAWGETTEAVRIDRDRIAEEAGRFCDHHRQKGSIFADWDAAFRTWLRNARRFDPSAPEPRRRPSTEYAPLPTITPEQKALADRYLAEAGGDQMAALDIAMREAGLV